MHDRSIQSQPATTETVVTRAACGLVGAFGLAAAIGLSSGGHDLLGATIGVAAAGAVIAIDTAALRRRSRRQALHGRRVAAMMAATGLDDARDPINFSDRSDDLSIPPFAPSPSGADKRDPASLSPSRAGSRDPLFPADVKAPVFDLPPLVQAALLVLAEADRGASDQGAVPIDVATLTRLRRAVSAEIEAGARAAAGGKVELTLVSNLGAVHPRRPAPPRRP